MLKEWRGGAQVVWAVRRQQPGARAHAGFASFYYWIMRHVVGMKEMPAQGADFFLVDRVVLDAFRQFGESNVSVLALITWIGFRQTYIEYDKQPRAAGRSGWSNVTTPPPVPPVRSTPGWGRRGCGSPIRGSGCATTSTRPTATTWTRT
jgi:hypothetical protein